MFSKVLIANRGEIAVRIIRACRELGIQTVAVYSEADKEALHTELADEAICIGPAKAADSYLNVQQILSAAIVTKAEAIHPGFGFLSENSRFAAMCEECNIVFIGPKSETIDAMGNKINARRLMIEAEVPVIPGSKGAISDVEEALTIAEEIGYPVMLKAAAGGGGKGIRKVADKEALPHHFASAQQEAKAAFGNDEMYIEKIIYPARHIEVQVLGDSFGNIIHLGERDCSLQRNNQKVLEESPSVVISESKRAELGEAAVRAAQAVGYRNAGTIEFLMADTGAFYFMEMNTRIQVEHPITEMVTNIDLVKKQLEVASGEPLGLTQTDIKMTGAAIECRINAENPAFNFAPSPGKINNLFLPGGGLGVRVDSAMYSGYTIPPYYDSMIAKVIVHGENRFEALMKMQRALAELVTDGVITNAEFQMDLISHPKVIAGDYTTAFLQEEFLPNWTPEQ
ncbi:MULTISPECIES: acetyl-CoA carboxylase biotin carboxylase subunit [Enterococcus]|jgi:acetyl-CoA carboxylase biotin carboxylase subunit|uniref:acetyl-CoA carboxylase biotin carboxylase subunit n=1 Tax=Enterococcus TaxID=1350 RepID=UPI0003533E58|nr:MULTISPECIES: acetyl-CoA carboxylase biotin carboxylase subunit [Enterococcus]AMG50909.1 acetyl-CoA carboxylase biotin carboxylase subunit [Enterococcus gallinarum]EPH93246.1 acetyl-CoA carboxylase, biotin carboxylase subunit [Enterococcus faecalis 06-MB-DW-09]MBO1120905.1 acetyl-CoA carboxylase biotin carboxylase subunit [Enterococcus casseliflavus]MBV6369993.1 acetyl-CoA carboxylase biotin carboxylase subunit [Enterococcus casseliflavus]MEC5316311.1 acetyl-CoA carboxylase biotin carboxyla